MFAAAFGHWHMIFAKWAFFRLVGRYGKVQQSLYFVVWNTEVRFATATVNQEAYTYDFALRSFYYVYNFANGTAGGYDIFNVSTRVPGSMRNPRRKVITPFHVR